MGSTFDVITSNNENTNTVTLSELKPLIKTAEYAIYEFPSPPESSSQISPKPLLRGTSRNKITVTSRPNQNLEIAMSYKQDKNEQMILKKCLPTEENALHSILSEMGFVNGKMKYLSKVKNNVCSVLGYTKQFKPFACGDNINFSILFEYEGEYTLGEELGLRAQAILMKTKRESEIIDRITVKKEFVFKINEVFRITKFLLDVSEELISSELIKKQQNFFPKLTLSDIFLVSKNTQDHISSQTTLKYRNPLDTIGCSGKENIYSIVPFSAYNEGILSHILSNLGFCLLELCLLEDCYSDCCNNFEVCRSLVEEKIEEMFEIYKTEAPEETVSELCSFIEKLIFQNSSSTKISLIEAKSICNKLQREQQKAILKNNTEINTTKQMISDLSTSFTQHMVRKASYERKSQDRDDFSDFPNKKTEEHAERVAKKKKSGRASATKLQATCTWSISKDPPNNMEENHSLTLESEWKVSDKKSDRLALRSITNLLKYEEIDKKWDESEELFKHMPSFENICSKIFDYQTNEEVEKIEALESNRQSILAFR